MHSHSHGPRKADKWTNIAAIGEVISSAASNFYWGVSLTDLVRESLGWDESQLNLTCLLNELSRLNLLSTVNELFLIDKLSPLLKEIFPLTNVSSNEPTINNTGLYVGLCFSVLALGSMYSHRKLNIHHQEPDAEQEEEKLTISNDEDSATQFQEHEGLKDIKDDAIKKPMNGHSNSDDHDEICQQDGHSHGHSHKHGHLSWYQKIALVADFITHTGDVNGAVAAGVDITVWKLKTSLPLWGKALVQCGATLFGAAAAYANVRTEKNAMQEQNKHNEHEERVVHSKRYVRLGGDDQV